MTAPHCPFASCPEPASCGLAGCLYITDVEMIGEADARLTDAPAMRRPKPGERGFQPGCGCCAGPVEDRCCCHMHQDIPRGLRAHKCSLHE